MVSLESSQCPLSTHAVCLYTVTNCKCLGALEGNNKQLPWKEELPPRADDRCNNSHWRTDSLPDDSSSNLPSEDCILLH
jgi:hypothetical protein